MRCMIVGVNSSHMKGYVEFLNKQSQVDKILIAGLDSEKEQFKAIAKRYSPKFEVIDLEESKAMSNHVETMTHVIISTELEASQKYIDFCIEHHISMLCNRPFSLSFNKRAEDDVNTPQYLKKWKESPVSLFEILKPQNRVKKGSVSTFFLNYSEQAKIKILNHFFFNQKADTQHLPSQDARDILIGFYNATTKGLNHTDFRFAVEIILEHKGKYLICKRRSDVKVAPGIWNVPGGKVKFNESMEEAVLRETKEETNLDLEECECIGYQFFNKKYQRLVYTYYSTVSDISNLKVDPTEFDDYTWVTTNDLAQYPSLNRHIVQLLQNH
ncbi:8-oxo-dGTP pyrophosphatase MutT (NUDIX family) [Staphylococcus auricularis]